VVAVAGPTAIAVECVVKPLLVKFIVSWCHVVRKIGEVTRPATAVTCSALRVRFRRCGWRLLARCYWLCTGCRLVLDLNRWLLGERHTGGGRGRRLRLNGQLSRGASHSRNAPKFEFGGNTATLAVPARSNCTGQAGCLRRAHADVGPGQAAGERLALPLVTVNTSWELVMELIGTVVPLATPSMLFWLPHCPSASHQHARRGATGVEIEAKRWL